VTIAELLSKVGYATGSFGKWHLGSAQGRLPNDRGFDEWYGIPRATDESMFPSQPGARALGMPFMHTMEGSKGEKSREVAVYDLDQRRLIDAEITRRTIDFMQRSVQAGKPFYAYVPFTLVHVPALPEPKFAGRTGHGDFADCLAEMDAHVGEILDAVDALKIRDNTIFIFTSDNGPDPTAPSQGWSGPWRGYYFTHMDQGGDDRRRDGGGRVAGEAAFPIPQLRPATAASLEHDFQRVRFRHRLLHAHGGREVQHPRELAERDKILLPRSRRERFPTQQRKPLYGDLSERWHAAGLRLLVALHLQ
jgi:hypothetical protein